MSSVLWREYQRSGWNETIQRHDRRIQQLTVRTPWMTASKRPRSDTEALVSRIRDDFRKHHERSSKPGCPNTLLCVWVCACVCSAPRQKNRRCIQRELITIDQTKERADSPLWLSHPLSPRAGCCNGLRTAVLPTGEQNSRPETAQRSLRARLWRARNSAFAHTARVFDALEEGGGERARRQQWASLQINDTQKAKLS